MQSIGTQFTDMLEYHFRQKIDKLIVRNKIKDLERNTSNNNPVERDFYKQKLMRYLIP